MELTFHLLGVLLLGVSPLIWLFYRSEMKQRQKSEQWEQEQQQRWQARYEATDGGLRDWLKALELPQLEDQMKLEAAARQLRTVLAERLMRMPRVR